MCDNKEFFEKANPVLAGNETECRLLTDGRQANIFYTYESNNTVVFTEKSRHKQRPQDMLLSCLTDMCV